MHTLLTLSPPIPSRLHTLPYWSNPPFLIFDIRVLWRSAFEQQQFGTADVEGVKHVVTCIYHSIKCSFCLACLSSVICDVVVKFCIQAGRQPIAAKQPEILTLDVCCVKYALIIICSSPDYVSLLQLISDRPYMYLLIVLL